MEIELRVILLGVGIIILFVVAYDFFKRKPAADALPSDNDYTPQRTNRLAQTEDYTESDLNLYLDATLPEVMNEQLPLSLEDPVEAAVADYASEDEYVSQEIEEPQKIITITIKARDKYGFSGSDLVEALESAGLEFGHNDVFHRYDQGESIFSVVNAVEPGYFIYETLPDEHIPGITLILLPERIANPIAAFDKFIRCAKQIAFALNGEMLDMQRQALTLETIDLYRKELHSPYKR